MAKSSSITVIGSTNVDFIMKMERLPQVGETVTDGVFLQTYGGKGANQAVAAARAGGAVTFVTCLGEDDFAHKIIDNFKADGINTRHILHERAVSTGTALVMIGNGGTNYLSVAPGSNHKITCEHIDALESLIRESQMLIVQMEIPLPSILRAIDLANQHGRKVILNLAPALPFPKPYIAKLFLLVVNESEAAALTDLPVETAEQVERAAHELWQLQPQGVVITLGAKGSYVHTSRFKGFIEAYDVQAVDTTAAGDTYCGSLAVALTEGEGIEDAVRFASAAAALSVTRMGARPSIPTRAEINAFMANLPVSRTGAR